MRTAWMALAMAGLVAPAWAEVLPLAEPIGYRCPPAGTVQTLSGGGRIDWQGTDPTMADTCLGQDARGGTLRRVRGIWPLGYAPSSWPDIQRAMQALTETRPGNEVALDIQETGNTGVRLHFRLQVLGHEAITMPDGPHDAIVIGGDETAARTPPYHGTVHAWIDRARFVVLRWQTTDLASGQTTIADTQSVILPP